MEKGLISVIVPCYNVGKYIEDCVRSLKAQTYACFEAIFVNDGSTDDTLSKLQALCVGDERFKLISQENKGLGGARNTGLSHAQGEYVTFLDSDDMYASSYLETLKQLIEKNEVDCVNCQKVNCKENFHPDKFDIKNNKHKSVFIEGSENIMCRVLAKRMGFSLTVWSKIFKHSILKEMRNYPNLFFPKTLYGEDIEFTSLYMAHCKKVMITYDKLYFYRLRKGSLLNSPFNEKKMTVFCGLKNVEDFCSEKNFQKGIVSVKALSSMVDMELLYRLSRSKHKDKQLSHKLIGSLKQDIKMLRKNKYSPLYMKMLSPIIPFVFQIIT